MKELFTAFSAVRQREENDKAMKINSDQWLDNQYPKSWSSLVASHALEKIISEGKHKKNMAEKKKGDLEKVLWAANLLHPNLQFTLEAPNTNGKRPSSSINFFT